MRNGLVYHLTAPLRVFGRSSRLRLIAGATIVVVVFFAATLWALDTFFPANDARKAVANMPKVPDLKPVMRQSTVIAPVAISLAAIRTTLDNAAPRDLAGKNDNPVSNLLSKADIGITVARGPMTVTGKPNELSVSTPLNGALKISGQLASKAGNLTGAISGLLGDSLGNRVGQITSQVLNQNAELRGQVSVRAQPTLTANWRLQPNLAAQVTLGDSALNIAGLKVNVASEAKPLIDKTVNEQMARLEQQLRNDTTIERTAREQWTKMCRSIELGGAATGLPPLYLEMKPVRAAAAQPQVDARNLTLVIGIQAETRIVPTATRPDCPFPTTLELVAPMQNGKLNVGVPIDMPFTALNKVIDAQLKGKHFPEDGSGAADVEVRGATVASAGDRLLVSLRVNVKERKSWFGLGAEATVNVWGKPVLDPANQIMRLADMTLDIQSGAYFGLVGAAARAAIPYVQDQLAESAKIDLKPFAADALTRIAATLKDFENVTDGVAVNTSVSALRLTAIDFDAQTLRVIAEADGSVRVAVTRLPAL